MKKITAMLLLTATVLSVLFVLVSCTSNVGNGDVKDTTKAENRVTDSIGTNILTTTGKPVVIPPVTNVPDSTGAKGRMNTFY
jgi:ABC-type Fe3+-citrate transport system substrate-binding protein